MPRRHWIAVLVAVAVAGCGGRREQPFDPSSYRGVEQGGILAWAWGGAAGFHGDGPHEVVVLFDPEPGDADQRLVSCNQRQNDCKSLADFRDTGVRPEFSDESLFGTFDTSVEKQDLLFLVVAKRGAKLVTSDVINATASSRPTGYARSEVRFDRRTQELAWPRLPESDLFIVEVVDSRDDRPLTAIATRRKSWAYPELQGLVQYFHDPSQVRDLRTGREYVVILYALNKQRWATLITDAVVKP